MCFGINVRIYSNRHRGFGFKNTWIDKFRTGQIGVKITSLSHPVGPDKNKSLSELIPQKTKKPIETIITQETIARVKEILAAMPEEQQLVFTLIYFQEMSYEEAAEVLDIPSGTVKSRISAAMMKLKERI